MSKNHRQNSPESIKSELSVVAAKRALRPELDAENPNELDVMLVRQLARAYLNSLATTTSHYKEPTRVPTYIAGTMYRKFIRHTISEQVAFDLRSGIAVLTFNTETDREKRFLPPYLKSLANLAMGDANKPKELEVIRLSIDEQNFKLPIGQHTEDEARHMAEKLLCLPDNPRTFAPNND